MRRALILAAVAGILGTSGTGHAHDPPGGPTIREQATGHASDFLLTDQDGRPIRLTDLRGRLVLMTFIYTSCPDACPLITADMARIQATLKTRGGPDAFLLSVTTDPEVDQAEVLKAYATRHGVDLTSWAFLTGSPADLRAVWNAYGVKVTRRAKGLVDHTGLTLLLDARGRIRYRYRGWRLDGPMVVADIERLAGEAGSGGRGHRP